MILEEFKRCSFIPQLNAKTKQIVPNRESSQGTGPYSQLFEFHKQKQEKLETMSQTLLDERCSFVPNIGEENRKLAMKVISDSNQEEFVNRLVREK